MPVDNTPNNETFPDSELPPPVERPIEPGEFVYLHDGASGLWKWEQVASVRVEDGRQKIRIVNTDFYFDEGIVAAVAYLTGGGI